MKTHLRLIAVAIAGLSLTACANRQLPQRAVWDATPTATVPQEQAQAKCDYELSQPDKRALWDELSIMAGTPMLNRYGQVQYQRCMLAQGFRFAGMAPVTGAGS